MSQATEPTDPASDEVFEINSIDELRSDQGDKFHSTCCSIEDDLLDGNTPLEVCRLYDISPKVIKQVNQYLINR